MSTFYISGAEAEAKVVLDIFKPINVLMQLLKKVSGANAIVFNFEDELVEGINRKPLDAFNQISERNKKAKNHLYKKRSGFTDRDETLLTEMRLLK